MSNIVKHKPINLSPEQRNHFKLLDKIFLEDLEATEKDLSFYELVSLGFLLFGADLTNAEYILQKLIILLKHKKEIDESSNCLMLNGKQDDDKKCIKTKSIKLLFGNAVLSPYARQNSTNWKATIIEALAIVRSKRVLRKLGFCWDDLRIYYLPHIPQLTINIHPMLKALYMLSEQLTFKQTDSLINFIHQEYFRKRLNKEVQLKFHDAHYLEIYLLYWISQRLIAIGDRDCQNTNIQPLIDYLQTYKLEALKSLLVETTKYNRSINDSNQINLTDSSNLVEKRTGDFKEQKDNKLLKSPTLENTDCDAKNSNSSNLTSSRLNKLIYLFKQFSKINLVSSSHNINIDRYLVRYSNAGYCLIINQSKFYQETDVNLKHLLPPQPFPCYREGTNVDRDRLSRLFSQHGYEVVIAENINHTNILRYIYDIVKVSINKDSLIVAILTHGAKDVVYGNNSIPVYLNDIQEIMSASGLKGKPKMLIIQACQKEHLNTTVNMINQIPRQRMSNMVDDSYADMLVALSALPGSESLRNTLKGSWYIEALCDVLEKFADSKHMVDILTIVTNAVTNMNRMEFMLPLFRSTLRKNFYLPKKSTISENPNDDE